MRTRSPNSNPDPTPTPNPNPIQAGQAGWSRRPPYIFVYFVITLVYFAGGEDNWLVA
jgi:hypothetical protein